MAVKDWYFAESEMSSYWLNFRHMFSNGNFRWRMNFLRPCCLGAGVTNPLRWRHNGHDGVSSQITSITIIYSNVLSGADKRKHHSSASLAFVRGIHRWPVNSPHKWPVTRKMFPFDDVIMLFLCCLTGSGWPFSNVASDWLAVVLPPSQKPC